MSLAVLKSRTLSGMNAPEVVVEVHLANGLPSFTIVGLPETEVKESKDRVRAALQTAQFEFPARSITVNLAPADLPKESGRYDLPIALGILAASGQIPKDMLDHYEYAGELALTGALRPVRGALAMTVNIAQAQKISSQPAQENRAFILPEESAAEAALVSNVVILPAKSLLEVCAHLSSHTQITPNINDGIDGWTGASTCRPLSWYWIRNSEAICSSDCWRFSYSYFLHFAAITIALSIFFK